MRQLHNLTDRIRALPVDKRGFPVPKFAYWENGEPDFRIVDPHHYRQCLARGKCWICGEQVGAYKAFVIGPMCVINRVSSEPPMHLDCAVFSVTNCPFLTMPMAKRNERGIEHLEDACPGIPLKHNPGVSCLWVTKNPHVFKDGMGGYLFNVGDPHSFDFYARGRKATRAELDAAVAKGFPALMELAVKEGPEAVKELEKERRAFDIAMDAMDWRVNELGASEEGTGGAQEPVV